MGCGTAWRTIRCVGLNCLTVGRGAAFAAVPTRTVFVLPIEIFGAKTAAPSPLILMGLSIGLAGFELNSQTPGERGLTLT